MLLTIIFIISTLLLLLLLTLYGYIESTFFVPFVFFIYGFSFFIDNIFFGITTLSLKGFEKLNINSNDYLIVTILYLFFLIGFSFFPILFIKRKKVFLIEQHCYKNNVFYENFLIIVAIFVTLYTTIELLGMERFEKIETFSTNKLGTISINISIFGTIILLVKNKFQNKKNRLITFLAIVIMFFGFIEGGREIFIYGILSFLFIKDSFNIKIWHFFLSVIVLSFIFIWKPFSVFVLQLNDFPAFLLWMSQNFKFSITSLDPLVSILMIADYNNGESFYNQFHFSYINNTLMQFLRTFRLVEYKSIGESLVLHYNKSFARSGGGLAFSGILESILNFWYFGPFILGFVLGAISTYISRLKISDSFNYKIFSIFFIILCLKLVRTELAVVLKIYLLPMIVAYFVFYRFTYSEKVISRELL